MPITSTFGGRRGTIAAAATAVLVLAGGGLVAHALNAPTAPPQPDTSQQVDTSGPQAASPLEATPPVAPSPASPADTPDFGPLLAPSDPVALHIPSIGVRAKGLVDLKRDKNGKMEAPEDFDRAGWYAEGPTPGEFGPSVIAAHVDSHLGPAVFYRLGSLKKGAKVMVQRKDGSTARFVVDKVARYSKSDFPTSTVYGDTKGRAELRLITCGGAIDQTTGHYVDNIVAFAHLDT